jgi:hypothetical protein
MGKQYFRSFDGNKKASGAVEKASPARTHDDTLLPLSPSEHSQLDNY